MSKIFFILLLAFVSVVSQAQISFERTYSDSGITNAYDIVATYDGGYAVTGFKTCSSFGCLDFFLLKLDSLGNVEWIRLYDGFGADDLPRSLVQTTDSGFVMAGRSASPPNVDDNVRLLKVDKNGNELWDRNYGGQGCEQGWDVEQTFDGGFIIATQADTGGTCNEIQIELIKTDALGIIEWQTQYYNAGQGRAVAVKQTADSGFVCTGVTNFMITATSGEDVFLLKTNKNGNEQWVKFYGNEGSERGEDVIIASDGGFVVVGHTQGYFNSNTIASYIIKTNISGDTLWTKVYEKDDSNQSFKGVEDDNNNIVLIGSAAQFSTGVSSFYLLKLSNVGSKIWEKTFKGAPNSNNGANSIALAHDGGYIMCGITSPSAQVYVVKTDTAGLIVGINEVTPTNNTTTVKVFPNPANDNLTISHNLETKDGKISLEIMDVMGRVLLNNTINNTNHQIDISQLASGLYFYNIIQHDKMIQSGKLVVE